MTDHPRYSAPVDLAPLEGAEHVWYRERSVLRFRARALLVVGVVSGLAVDALRIPAILLAVLLAPAAAAAVSVALRGAR